MTYELTPAHEAAIRYRLRGLTPGPWEASEDRNVWILRVKDSPYQILKAPKGSTPYAEYWPNQKEAEFIVSARRDVPVLLAEIDRLRKELHELRGM